MRRWRASARDIGPIPSPQHPRRRRRCRENLAAFLSTYMPGTFDRRWSPDHLQVLEKIQRCVLDGGVYAQGIYRGFGKTCIAEGAALWATLYGHRSYVTIIAGTEDLARSSVASVGTELTNSAALLADFPEVCVPFAALEGISHRCRGQLCEGKLTHIGLGVKTLTLPTIAGSRASGAVIGGYGLTGRLRGLKHKHPDGRVVRPDFCVIDDPQDDESAASPAQCDKRERLILGAVRGLGGHFTPLSAVMPCTIIYKDDLADRFLDRSRHPDWQGDILPMVRTWPERHDLWMGEYADLRRQEIPDARGGAAEAHRQATSFYRAHRREMESGSELSWPECFDIGELSAIQHAYNRRIDAMARGREHVFFAEYQCAPLDEFEGVEPPLEVRDVLTRLNNLPRHTCPVGTSALVAFIDPGSQAHLHFMVMALGDGFTGAIVDYGRRPVTRGKRGGMESAVTAALTALVDEICARSWPSETGGALELERLVIDSGWLARPVVYPLCRNDPHRGVLTPGKGQGGELELRWPKGCPRRDRGDGWWHRLTKEKDARLLMYDADHWKTVAEERLRVPPGGRGAVTVWGARGNAAAERYHRELAEHLTSERAAPKEKKTGDSFKKWQALPGRANHWWDCFVGCMVAGARAGITLEGTAPRPAAQVRPAPPPALPGGGGWKIGR